MTSSSLNKSPDSTTNNPKEKEINYIEDEIPLNLDMNKRVTVNQSNCNPTQDGEVQLKIETVRSLANLLNKLTDSTTKNPNENKFNYIEHAIHEIHPNEEKNESDTISQCHYNPIQNINVSLNLNRKK